MQAQTKMRTKNENLKNQINALGEHSRKQTQEKKQSKNPDAGEFRKDADAD